MNERRKNRSPFKDEALRLWLEAVVERAGCRAMAVGDEAGFMAAGTDQAQTEVLAGVAARHAAAGEEVVVAFEGASMGVRTLELGGQKIIVAAVGSPEACHRALAEAQDGLLRIMDG